MDDILVGIDGSESAKQALRWALEEARCHGATLTVTTVAPDTRRSGMPYATRRGDVVLEAESLLNDTVQEVVGERTDADVETRIETGDPREVLRELSRGTDLLVVGSRGHGEIAGLLLGSVGQYLVTHAHCPVTVVRPLQEDPDDLHGSSDPGR